MSSVVIGYTGNPWACGHHLELPTYTYPPKRIQIHHRYAKCQAVEAREESPKGDSTQILLGLLQVSG